MNLSTICVVLVAIVLFPRCTFAQEDTLALSRFISTGMGTLKVDLRDDHMSPMKYSNTFLTPYLSYEKEKAGKLLSSLELYGALGNIRSENSTEERPMKGKYYRLDIEYAYLRFMDHIINERYRWFLGGNYHFHGNVRLNEQLDTSFITFIFLNGLSLSNMVERDLQMLNRSVKIRYRLELPLVTHVIRPNYLNIYNYLDPENDWLVERLQDSELLLAGKMFRMKSRLELLYPIKSDNNLKFTYAWDYYSLSDKLHAKAAGHQFLFTYMLYF